MQIILDVLTMRAIRNGLLFWAPCIWCTHTFIINLWSIGSAQHLKHVRYRVVFVRVYLAVIVLRVHDDDEVSRQTKTPRQTSWHDYHLDITANEQVFYKSTFQFCQTLV